MLSVKGASHKKQYSRPTAINSSEGGTAHSTNMTTASHQPAVSLSQRFSNAAGPSTSLLAANGEFHKERKSLAQETVDICSAQKETDRASHGSINAVSFDFDKSTGYLPPGDHPSRPHQESLMRRADTPITGYLSLDSFLHLVSSERLNRMPHRASKWDRVIRLLEGLALQISASNIGHGSSVSSSEGIASQTYSTCYDLLRMSSGNGAFIDLAYPVLSNVHNVLSLILRHADLLTHNERTQKLLDQLMESVLSILRETVTCAQDGISRARSARLTRTSGGVIHDRKDRLVDELWSCQLSPDASGSTDDSEQSAAIRNWLLPYDTLVCDVYADLDSARNLHAEFTCEWFSKPLLDFIRRPDKAFWIEGPAGCGKSMLCGWIIESLQNQVAGQDFAVLSYIVDPILPTELVISSLLKALLRQAYDQNPGRMNLRAALTKVRNTPVTLDYPLEVISALWDGFEVLCKETHHPSIIVIDGFSELSGGNAFVNGCLKRMLDSVSRSPMIRLLILSRPIAESPDIAIRRFAIDPAQTRQDVRRSLEESIPSGSIGKLQETVTWISNKANGNFLWSLLALQWCIPKQGEGIPAQVESLPQCLDAMIFTLISSIDFTNPSVRVLMLASVVAARPFSVAEVQSLLSVDMVDKSFYRQDLDVRNLVQQRCGLIMMISNDNVQFRHHTIQRAVGEFALKHLRSSPVDIHGDLTSRLLLYLRLMETPHAELSMVPIASCIVEEMLQTNQLSSYALQYWTYHAAQMGSANGTYPLLSISDIGLVLPDTTSMAVLEASYWARKAPYDALQALRISARARREILGDHTATLQCTASLAVRLRDANRLPEAAATFAAAFNLSQQILSDFHNFGADCASQFLGCLASSSFPQSASTEFEVTKSTILLYMRARYSQQSGPSSDQALDFSHLLGRHYAETGQDALCIQIYREIYKLTVDRHGQSSSQAQTVAGQLVNILEQSERTEDQDQLDDTVYDNVMNIFAITDSRRIKASILKAAAFKSRNDLTNAEIVYLELLQQVTQSCQEPGTDEDQLQLLRVGLLFSGFLAEQCRVEEAQMVILGLWARFENHRGQDPAENELLKNLAVEAQQRGLPTMALTILNSVTEWSKVHGVHHEEFQEVEATLAEFSYALIRNNERGTILPKSTEEILMRTFESAKVSGASAITASLVQMTQTLVDSLSLEHRWYEVVQIATSLLWMVWPSILENPCECSAPDEYVRPLEDVALSLAKAYSNIDEEAFAGHIYLHLLRSAKSSTDRDSKFIVDIAQAALQIFENLGRSNETISVTQDLVDHYRATLGNDDALTIGATYRLASLCMRHGETKTAKRCYFKIANSLKKADYHDQRAIPALKAMLPILFREQNWVQAKEVYSSLWQTFLNKAKEYSAREETVRSLFKGYSQLLENYVSVDPDALHQLREEYRTGCADVFGCQALITLEASLCLAKSWERRERGLLNAISIYETIVDGQARDGRPAHHDVLGILERAELAVLEYYCAHSDDEMDSRTLRRAIELQKKHHLKEKAHFGCYSLGSLSSLALYVKFLTKETSPESRDAAVQELTRATEVVLQSDCEGKASFDAAVILASCFVSCGYITEGRNRAHQIRENIILGAEGDKQCQRDSVRWSHRSQLTFSAAFETRIRGSLEEFTSIYSLRLLETTLWQSFQVLVRTSSPLELVLSRGTRLQALLKSDGSSYCDERIEQQMFDRFLETYGAAFTTGTHTTKSFFLVLIKSMSEVRSDPVLPHLACVSLNDEIRRLVTLGEYAKIFEIATAGFEFIRFIGAYGNKSYVQYGFHLGLLLGNQPSPLLSNHVLSQQLLELSKMVLREVTQVCRTRGFGFDTMDIDELSKVAAALGKQQNYHDLEWLLNQLWLSRHNRGALSQDLIVTLGRRLVDVRFFHGHIDSAIDLAEDILYNLRHVYGPSHRWAVEMMNLLSSMYMSKGDRSAAMAVLDAADLGPGSAMHDDHVRDATRPESPNSAKQVKAKIEYLLKFYQQNVNNESSVQQSATLVDELSRRLIAPTLITERGDMTGHQPPPSWSFADEETRSQS